MFEHSLIDLDAELEAKTNPRRRRWIWLPLAIGLHLVGLTAFAFASYWNVGPVIGALASTSPYIDVPLLPPGLPPAGWRGASKTPRARAASAQAGTGPGPATRRLSRTDVPDTPVHSDAPGGRYTSSGPVHQPRGSL